MKFRMEYYNFLKRLALFASKRPDILTMTLQNIFSMRRIGNKTHGDMAEVAISEFINQYMYDFSSLHVGKDLFRAKQHEEDIRVTNEITKTAIPISLKAYGVGPLQLSTDKTSSLFPTLKKLGAEIRQEQIRQVLSEKSFNEVRNLHVLPLIYDERKKLCNVMWFDIDRALDSTCVIRCVEDGNRRKHPVYIFEDKDGDYICEVRYGDAQANALQRGLWTHTERAERYFNKLFETWIQYNDNETLLNLISRALVASEVGHEVALAAIVNDIETIKNKRI